MRTVFLYGILIVAGLSLENIFGVVSDQCLAGRLVESCTTTVQYLQEEMKKMQQSFNAKIEELLEKGRERDRLLEDLTSATKSVNVTVQLQGQHQRAAEETLSSSINELQTQVVDINDTVVKLSAPTPSGHVFGSRTSLGEALGSGDGDVTEENDGTVTLWQNDRTSDDAPILSGGMEFNGTSFTVPESGTYYIYGLLMIQNDGVSECGWELLINNVGNLMIIDQSINGTKQSIFGSQVREMNEGDSVLMQSKNCKYNFGVDASHFGIYQLQREI
ncbi:uncharacterized protein LOC134198422 [Corticium candelabrum]|uniref:uncharacterized protein LOC134198422 n=1 Tax=Corticium candelabrum TaxID=121492 RepID=UPI002E26F416|nr:uncharacterized protein LOC134198422 [Corticium candelabrum]